MDIKNRQFYLKQNHYWWWKEILGFSTHTYNPVFEKYTVIFAGEVFLPSIPPFFFLSLSLLPSLPSLSFSLECL